MENTPWTIRTPWMDTIVPDTLLYLNMEPDVITTIMKKQNNGTSSAMSLYESMTAPFIINTSSQRLVSRLLVRNIASAVRTRDRFYLTLACASINSLLAANNDDVCVYDACNACKTDNYTTTTAYCDQPDISNTCFISKFTNKCSSLCRTPEVIFNQQPRVVSLVDIRSPVVQFVIMSNASTRMCSCPDYMDFIDHNPVDYTHTISTVNGEAIKEYPQQQISTLLDGNLVLSMTDYPFRFGVEYHVSITVVMRTITEGPAISSPFTLESCPTNQRSANNPLGGQQIAAINNTASCVTCPTNGICNGTLIVLAKRNTFRPSTAYAVFLPCDESTQSCTTTGGERYGFECSVGYEGFLCSVCSHGYGKSGVLCAECPSSSAIHSIVTFAVFATFIFYVGMCYTAVIRNDTNPVQSNNQPTQASTSTKDLIQGCFENVPPIGGDVHPSSVHIITIDEAEPWTTRVRKAVVVPLLRLVKIVLTWLFCVGLLFQTKFASYLILSIRSVLGYSHQISTVSPLNSNAFACIVQYPVYVTFLVYTAGAIPITVACTFTLYVVTRIRDAKTKSKTKRVLWPMSMYSSFICCFALLYPQVVVSVIQILQCDETELPLWNDGSSPPISHRSNLLHADRRISCDQSNHEYQSYRMGAILVAVFYGVGFPLTCVLTRKHVPLQIFNFLSEDVVPKAWWWELFVMTRKASLLLCVSVVPVDDLQIISYNAVLFIVFGVFLKWRPYADRMYNYMEFISILSCCCVSVLLGFLGHYHTQDDDQNVKLGIEISIVLVVGFVAVVYAVQFIFLAKTGIESFRNEA